MEFPKDRTIVASDVNLRDGIGVEIYRNDELVVEIFRDDTQLTRTVTIFKQEIGLELLEECIEIFKKEIPWDFIDYDKFNEKQTDEKK
ncbi:hypothetical protein [Cellulophaga sp. BC115SP]|uniref:hypothetical protein n=1 Tax=Cellulophaga sp. BC115SP TaxID=2683263 RepID=UPI0014124A8C|nr:hypothetical protein [Cellulophaga sp. BC115SP]NBB32083.1 hypothetical protein [Cellulophaga sp. BC115SP]